MKKVSITKEQINELPVVDFRGDIYVVDKFSQVRPAVERLRRFSLIGFDTETRPSFRAGVRHKVALIQLATPLECFLFRVCRLGMPALLREFLEDESVTKVGLSVHDDFNQMRRMEAEMEPKGFVDIQSVVSEYEINDLSLQKIYAILFGRRISKSQQLTNWEAPELTEAQQRYAAIDAWACIDIYNYLSHGLFHPSLSAYYHETEPPQ